MRWKFLLPTTARLSQDIPARYFVKVFGSRFYVRRRESAEREIPADLIASNPRVAALRSQRRWATFLSVSASGEEWEEAWKAIIPAFDSFRGLLEMTAQLGRWEFVAAPTARALISHPPALFALPESGKPVAERFYLYEEALRPRPFEIDKALVDGVKRIAKPLRGLPEEDATESLIGDALRLYAQALDAGFDYATFLGLWQMAEAMCISERFGGETKKVARWLAQWGIPDAGFASSLSQDELEQFGQKRNEIVHHGIHSVTDYHVNRLKSACETAFVRLWTERQVLHTKRHLREFYRMRDDPNAVLEARRDALRKIISDRATGG